MRKIIKEDIPKIEEYIASKKKKNFMIFLPKNCPFKK